MLYHLQTMAFVRVTIQLSLYSTICRRFLVALRQIMQYNYVGLGTFQVFFHQQKYYLSKKIFAYSRNRTPNLSHFD